jgi:hypothetical protein
MEESKKCKGTSRIVCVLARSAREEEGQLYHARKELLHFSVGVSIILC